MTDYAAIDPPDDKPSAEYTYVERRAEIWNRIETRGYPGGFNYSQLGRRYDVSHTQIRKDFETLKEWYLEHVGADATVTSDIAYQRIIREHMDNGDYEKARRALDSWNGWLQDTGEQSTEPDRVEHTGEDGEAIEIALNETIVGTGHTEDE